MMGRLSLACKEKPLYTFFTFFPRSMIPLLFASRYEILTKTRGVVESCLQPVKRSVRVNTNKISKSSFLALVKKNGWQLSPVLWEENGFFIDRDDKTIPLGKTLEHYLGLFYLQEASSMLPATVLHPAESDIVLDMAAAPGSKTTQLSNIMNTKGLVLSNDFSIARTKALATNIERQGCINVGISTMNGKIFGDMLPDTFDKILLDAPCSGEGTAWKDPTFFNRWNLDMVKRCAGLQKSLVLSAFDALRVSGEMVYSTCTFAPEENEAVIDFLLCQRGEAKIIEIQKQSSYSLGIVEWQRTIFHPSLSKTVHLYPHKTMTGGFFIAHIKKADGDAIHKERKDFRSKEKILGEKEKKQYVVYLRKTYGIPESIFEGFVFTRIEDTVWMKPEKYLLLSHYIRMDRCGIKLFIIDCNGSYKLTTSAAWGLGQQADRNVVVLDEEQTTTFVAGKNVRLSDSQTKDLDHDSVIVKDERGFVLGVSLFQTPATLKNQIPRHFVVTG